MNFRLKNGFALIELLISLLIISTLLIFAVEEYRRHIINTKITRARADIEELAKAIRLYNIKEPQNFAVTTFSPEALGNFVGTYLEKEPPRDPWGVYYLHSPEQGLVFSTGPDGKPQTTTVASVSDDIVLSYIPRGFFITRAEYVDTNMNNIVDFSDCIDLTFSRPAKLKDPMAVDFETANPVRALGTALIKAGESTFRAKIEFVPPIASKVVPGQTKLFPREFIESITDFSPVPQRLGRIDKLTIEKRR